MPELPEVQTVLSTLEHMIAHKRIESIEILSPDVVQCDSDEFSFENRYNILFDNFYEHISHNNKLYLSGFLLFQMQAISVQLTVRH